MGNARRIGLYGGTFDPIHLGHLNLANEMVAKGKADEVWFIPAKSNPFKGEDASGASPEQRMEMVRLAIAPYPYFKALDIELRRPAPSYTYDTIAALIEQEKAQGSDASFALILGADAAAGLPRWHRIEEIITLVPLYIGSRNGSFALAEGSPALKRAVEQGSCPTRLLDISATELRSRLKEGKDCSGLLPKEVLDYIKYNRIYL